MLERRKIQRQLWVKGSFQFFLTIQRWMPCSLCFYITHLPRQKCWLLLPRTGSGCLRNWEFLCWVQGRAWGLPGCPVTVRHLLTNTGKPHMLCKSFSRPASDGHTRNTGLCCTLTSKNINGFSPCLTAHLTIYPNAFLASLLSSHAKSTNTC